MGGRLPAKEGGRIRLYIFFNNSNLGSVRFLDALEGLIGYDEKDTPKNDLLLLPVFPLTGEDDADADADANDNMDDADLAL